MLDVISKMYMLFNLLCGLLNIVLNVTFLVLFLKHIKKQKHLKQNSTQQIPITLTQQNNVDLMMQNMHQKLNQLRYGTFSPIKSQKGKLP